MRKTLLLRMLLAAFVCLACSFEAKAQWQRLYSIRAPYCMHIAPNGNMLVADYMFDGTGGIYLSEDKGRKWTKTDAPDYTYGRFIDAGKYIIATGAKGRVARSEDGGKSWEVTNYAGAIEDIMTPDAIDRTICYAATMHKGKLFVGDFGGGGVLYSEDFGETWVRTDVESLQYEATGKDGKPMKATETIYNIISYKDELYAFGIFYVFKYDEANDKWVALRSDSNFMSQHTVHNDLLVMSRTVMNQTTDCEFLITFDGEEWGELPRPEGWLDNNIRCLDSDGGNLYIGFQECGFWYTSNYGADWTTKNEGLPLLKNDGSDYIQHMIDLAHDDEYVYAVIYDTPFSTRRIDGIYRISKENTPVGIQRVEEASDVYSDGKYLHVGNCEQLILSDLSGKTIKAERNGGKVDLQGLGRGVYIYNVVHNGKVASGKFVKE